MFFKFGNFQHKNDEVNLTTFEVSPHYGPRGTETTRTMRLHASGLLLTDPALTTVAARQADLNTKIGQFIDAYSLQDMDQNCGLYHDDGTVTRHRLESSTTNPNNVSGVRLVDRNWPKGEPEEYATGREFFMILEAVYANAESQLVDFRETIRKVGTCGPRFAWTEFQTIAPQRQLIHQYTTQKIIQEGYAIGFSGYITAPGALLPGIEDQDLQTIEVESPEFAGRRYINYMTRWRYVMTAGSNQSLIPNFAA